MTVATITNTTWTITCEACKIVRNILVGIWVGMMAAGESAGRARAARELSRQGYHAEAKALMLAPREFDKND